MAAGPADAGEVQRVTGGVDLGPLRVGDQRLPGGPTAALAPGPADRLAPAGPRRRVGIEDDQQVPACECRAGVASGRRSRGWRRCGGPAPRAPAPAPPAAVPSRGVVVDDDQLVAVAQLRQQRRQGPGQLHTAVPGDDQDGERRTHRRGGYSAIRAGASNGLLRSYFFFLPQQLSDVQPELVVLDLLAVLSPSCSDTAVCFFAQRLVELTRRLFLPPCMLRMNFFTGDIRHFREDGLETASLGADDAAELDVHLTTEVGDQVRQLVVGGDQVDRALQLAFEQRRLRFRVAVDRCLRAGLRGQLGPGADRLDVALVEEQRVRQRQGRTGQVGVAFACFQDRPDAAGSSPAVVGPNSRVNSFGLNASLLHSVAWNGALTP